LGLVLDKKDKGVKDMTMEKTKIKLITVNCAYCKREFQISEDSLKPRKGDREHGEPEIVYPSVKNRVCSERCMTASIEEFLGSN